MLPTITITRPDRDRLANIVQALSLRSQDALADFLDQEISRARIVEPGDIPSDVVTMNSRVVYRDEEAGAERTARLVYPGEENSDTGNLSVLTPVGTALLGLRCGQSIEWTTRDGRPRRLTLIRVLSQPEWPKVR
jgi:regulator of nucleoside diphosphate kinase